MKKQKPISPVQSPYQQAQDAWQRELEKAVALAIGSWLTESGINLNRPIASLELRDLISMGIAACMAYTNKREERRKQLCLGNPPGNPLDPDPLDQIFGS